MTQAFKVGDQVRYTPGFLLDANGTVPAEVIGFTNSRVRIRTKSPFTKRSVTRAVHMKSLSPLS